MERLVRITVRATIGATYREIRSIVAQVNPVYLTYDVTLGRQSIDLDHRLNQEDGQRKGNSQLEVDIQTRIWVNKWIVDIEDVNAVRTSKLRRKPQKKLLLWQFVLQCLSEPTQNRDIQWLDQRGAFQLINPEEFAQKWGRYKQHSNMNHSKMARAFRSYYGGKNLLTKLPAVRWGYRINWEAVEREQRLAER